MTTGDLLLNIANVCVLASFSVRDILKLRALSILGGLFFIAYFLTSAPPNVTGIAWNTLFGLFNLFHIGRLWLERRPVTLSDDEARLYQLVFRSLTPRECVALAQAGTWRDTEAGAVLCEEGQSMDELLVVVHGEARVEVGGRAVGRVAPGRFVGEMSYLTDAPSSASVRTEGPTRLIAWDQDVLRRFLEDQPPIKAAVQRLLGTDLAAKLRAMGGS